MAAPQIIINAILYPLGVAYRHGGHTPSTASSHRLCCEYRTEILAFYYGWYGNPQINGE
jgi:hypothetical protein